MKALTYIEYGKFALTEKPKPETLDSRDAVVRGTLGSICTKDLSYANNCTDPIGDSAGLLALIEAGRIDRTPLIPIG